MIGVSGNQTGRTIELFRHKHSDQRMRKRQRRKRPQAIRAFATDSCQSIGAPDEKCDIAAQMAPLFDLSGKP